MTETQYAVARKMWADGASMKSIAYKVGMTLKELASVTRSHRDDFPRRRDSTHLTDEQIASIHSRRSSASCASHAIRANEPRLQGAVLEDAVRGDVQRPPRARHRRDTRGGVRGHRGRVHEEVLLAGPRRVPSQVRHEHGVLERFRKHTLMDGVRT